jgi:hypothetical protein
LEGDQIGDQGIIEGKDVLRLVMLPDIKIDSQIGTAGATVGQTVKENESDSLSDEEYERRNRSCKEVSSDELEGDLNLSEDEEVA